MQMQSQETVMQIEMIVAIILLIVFFISIPVNILVFRVHQRFERKTTYRFLIKTLMMTDLAICVASIARLGLTVHKAATGYQGDPFYKANQVLTQMIEGLALYTAVTIASLAAERYEAICRPYRRYLNLAKVRLVALLVGASTLLWIGGGICGTISGHSWYDVAVVISAAVIVIVLIWVVGVYIRICRKVRDRARVRADLRNCYACRVSTVGRRWVKPPTSILKVTASSHVEGDAVSTGNVFNISERVTMMTNHTPTTQIAPDLTPDAPPTDAVSSTQALQKSTIRTRTGAPGPSTADNPATNALTSNNTYLANCPSARLDRRRCRCSEDGQAAAKISVMLVLTTVVHVVSWLPFLAYSFVLVFDPPQNSTLYIAMWWLDHLCYLNAALNPFIYGLSNGEFRREFRDATRCDFRV